MDFKDQVKDLRIDMTHSEVQRSNQNQSTEGEIRHLKNNSQKKYSAQ